MKQHDRPSICTYSGVEFFPLSPTVETVFLADIAHGLANTCRYNGQCHSFYSVAQHSVLVSEMLEDTGVELAKWGLLHDAAEAYVSDVCRPIKHLIPGYADIEARLMQVIASVFGLPSEEPSAVKLADRMVFLAERNALFPKIGWWNDKIEGVDAPKIDIVPWSPEEAEHMFVAQFRRLFGRELTKAMLRP